MGFLWTRHFDITDTDSLPCWTKHHAEIYTYASIVVRHESNKYRFCRPYAKPTLKQAIGLLIRRDEICVASAQIVDGIPPTILTNHNECIQCWN